MVEAQSPAALSNKVVVSGPKLNLWIAAALLVCVWVFARFGGHEPSRTDPAVGVFKRPIMFEVTPPKPVKTINVRSGPGAQFRVIGHRKPGTRVLGIERVTDTNSAFWIRLSNDRGFVKESILTPSPGGERP